MFKTITDKSQMIKDPVLEMEISSAYDVINLFGKEYRMYKDEWKHHVHFKCTNNCDANCAFCIERDSRHDGGNPKKFYESCSQLLEQLNEQGMLRTVSITGGEPSIFPLINETIGLINKYDVMLFSMNTNGRLLNALDRDIVNGWLNISKHSTHDAHIFKREFEVTPEYLAEIRARQPRAKIRFQCVLGLEDGLQSLDEVKAFIKHYNDVVDDFSFRSLIVENKDGEVPQLFKDLRDWLFPHCVEQTIQDYYVYEVYDVEGYKPITISWSNMYLLKQYNESNNDNFLEEIIVHPDGMITGSWNKKTLIIKE